MSRSAAAATLAAKYPAEALAYIEERMLLLTSCEEGLNQHYGEVEAKCLEIGLATNDTSYTPDAMCPHPANRGGVIIAHGDAHDIMADVWRGGVDMTELVKATGIELCPIDPQRAEQFQAIQGAIDRAEGMLAPMTGHERIAMLACTHFFAGLKAAAAGCRTPKVELQANGDRMSKEHMLRKPLFEVIYTRGVKVTVYTWEAEVIFPALPRIIQKAKNAAGQNARRQKEWDVLLAISDEARSMIAAGKTPDWAACAAVACSSNPPCKGYKEKLCSLAQNHAGGPDAPLLHHLAAVSATHYVTRPLGGEKISAVLDLNFGAMRPCTMLRCAALITEMTAPSDKDGFAQCVSSSTLKRLCGKDLKILSIEVDDMLAQCHSMLRKSELSSTWVNRAFSKLEVELITHLLGVESSHMYNVKHPSCAAICDIFVRQLNASANKKFVSPWGKKRSRPTRAFLRAHRAMAWRSWHTPPRLPSYAIQFLC